MHAAGLPSPLILRSCQDAVKTVSILLARCYLLRLESMCILKVHLQLLCYCLPKKVSAGSLTVITSTKCCKRQYDGVKRQHCHPLCVLFQDTARHLFIPVNILQTALYDAKQPRCKSNTWLQHAEVANDGSPPKTMDVTEEWSSIRIPNAMDDSNNFVLGESWQHMVSILQGRTHIL